VRHAGQRIQTAAVRQTSTIPASHPLAGGLMRGRGQFATEQATGSSAARLTMAREDVRPIIITETSFRHPQLCSTAALPTATPVALGIGEMAWARSVACRSRYGSHAPFNTAFLAKYSSIEIETKYTDNGIHHDSIPSQANGPVLTKNETKGGRNVIQTNICI
jgi:hypothetical protein